MSSKCFNKWLIYEHIWCLGQNLHIKWFSKLLYNGWSLRLSPCLCCFEIVLWAVLWQKVQRYTLTLIICYFKFWCRRALKTNEGSVTMKRNKEVAFEFVSSKPGKYLFLHLPHLSFGCVGKALSFSILSCFPLDWDNRCLSKTRDTEGKRASCSTWRHLEAHQS